MGTANYVISGFDAVGYAAGIKKDGSADLAIIASAVPCRAAAIFTRNAFTAAPVLYDQRLLSFNAVQIHGVVINSGNANACTGVQGDANARLTAEAAERALGAPENSIFVMSTGVIGVQLPMEKLTDAIPHAAVALNPSGWPDAARAIMTTDTVAKCVTRQVQIEKTPVRLTGIAKGAGMIHPNMATMLAVVATDAHIAQPLLQQALFTAAEGSFNRISVDGDTSTNDTVLALANGLADHDEIADAGSAAYQIFLAALTDLCRELAQALVRDAEGATKFVSVQVMGAASDEEAHQAANTVAISPLVKTAFFGSDANWGRLLMAVGRAGIQVDPGSCSLFICGGVTGQERLPELQLVEGGTPLTYAEADAAHIFSQPEIDVRIDLGLDSGNAIVWTSDFSHDYVTINGDYRT